MSSFFTPPHPQLLDGNGDPYAGAKAYFYEAGTTTLLKVYTTSDLSIEASNPVIADANGRFAAIWMSAITYKVVMKDSSDVEIFTEDNIPSSFDAVGSVFVSAYGTDVAALQAANDAAVAAGKELVIDVPITLTSTMNPSAEVVRFTPYGSITHSGSSNMTFLSSVKSVVIPDKHEAFKSFPAGGANLSFNTAGQVDGTRPEWFEAKRDGSTDDKQAINLAISEGNKAKAVLGAGTYAIDGSAANIDIKSSDKGIVGQGREKTTLEDTNAAVNTAVQSVGVDASRIANPWVEGVLINRSSALTTTGGVGIDMEWTTHAYLHDLQVEGFLKGVKVKRSTNAQVNDVIVSYAGSSASNYGFDIDGDGGGSGALGNASSVFWRFSASRTTANTPTEISAGTTSTALYVHGEYSGDLKFRDYSTLRFYIGTKIDFSGVSDDSNGNNNHWHTGFEHDGITGLGFLVDGKTGGDSDDNFTISSGWINFTGTAGYSGLYAFLLREGFGGNIFDVQVRYKGTSANPIFMQVEGWDHLHVNNGHRLKNLYDGILFKDGTADNTDNIVKIGSFVNESGSVSLHNAALFESKAKRNLVEIGDISGYTSTVAVNFNSSAANNALYLPKYIDTTNFTTFTPFGSARPYVILDDGTGTFIDARQLPADNILSRGSSRNYWTDWGDIGNVVLSSGTGTPTDATVTAQFRWVGDMVDVRYKVEVVDKGGASGYFKLSLPYDADANAHYVNFNGNGNYKQLSGMIISGQEGYVRIYRYDAADAWANTTFWITGTYKPA